MAHGYLIVLLTSGVIVWPRPIFFTIRASTSARKTFN